MAGQDVQGMLIRIEATTAQLRQEMDKADASVTKATGRIDDQLGKVFKCSAAGALFGLSLNFAVF